MFNAKFGEKCRILEKWDSVKRIWAKYSERETVSPVQIVLDILKISKLPSSN